MSRHSKRRMVAGTRVLAPGYDEYHPCESGADCGNGVLGGGICGECQEDNDE